MQLSIKPSLIVAAMAFSILFPSSGQSACQSQMKDEYKPAALRCAGKWPCHVDDENIEFTYQSDVEEVKGDFTLNNVICNRHKDDLVVIWNKGGLGTSLLNGLPENCCLTNPHPIHGIEEIDYDAPILYTQSKRPRDAAVYKENGPTERKRKKLGSFLKTSYRNIKGSVKDLAIRVLTSFLPDKKLMMVEIERSSPEVSFALGSLWRVAKANQITKVTSKIAFVQKEGGKISFLPVSKTLQQEDLAWLPKLLTDDVLLVFRPGETDRQVVRFSVPLQRGSIEAYGVTTGSLMALDNDSRLIGIGRYSLFVPK